MATADAGWRRASPARRRQALTAWALCIPFLLLFFVFMAGPVLASLGMSFTDIRSADLKTPTVVSGVGLEHYAQLLADSTFQKALFNTGYFVVVGVPLTMALAMAAALGLNRITRLRAFFRIGYYLPVVTSVVAVAVVWRFLLQPDAGLFNTVLGWVGIEGPNWLEDPTWAMPSIIAMASWRNLGTLMVIFLAGLQTVPKDMLEAAEMDGAGAWRRFTGVVASRPAPDPALRWGLHHGRLPAVLRGAARDDPGRTARQHAVDVVLRVQPVRVRQLRLRICRRLRTVRRHRRRHPRAVPPPEGAVMRTRLDSHGDVRTPAWLYVVLTAGMALMLGPFVWMLLGSVKSENEIRRVPPTWLPDQPTTENFADLFQRLDFQTYFFNSLLVAVAVTLGNLAFASMVGYALAKLDFPGRRVIFVLVLGALMVPGMAIFIPQFVLVANLGLVNTYAGLILPFLVQPVGIFLMRQFIGGLPNELIEAARIDGAGELRIFARVIMPLCGPALATLAILTFLGSWNNFLWPLVVAQSEDKYTLPVALALYAVGENQTKFGAADGRCRSSWRSR